MPLLSMLLLALGFLCGEIIVAETLPNNCETLVGSCDYYSCIEQDRLSCGEESYALNYGKKYCEIFSGLEFKDASSAFARRLYPGFGKQWRDQLRLCLQRSLEAWFSANIKKSCSSLQAFAFNTHAECFTQDPSFCELTRESVFAVFRAIEVKDLLDPQGLQQVEEIAQICGAQLDDRIAVEKTWLLRWHLMEYRAFWKRLERDPESVIKRLQKL